MKTQILPGKGFISDNDSYQFGTSGHEELLFSPHAEGTLIDYTYQVTIHKKWLRIIAVPLLRWYSMKYWEKAVIVELKKSYTIIIVTHNMQQAARVSDYTAYMYLGELIEYGDTDMIFTRPTRKETEDYITGKFG